MTTRIFVKACEGHEYMVGSPIGQFGHPEDGALEAEGSWWGKDAYTWRLIKDGSLEEDKTKQPLESASPGPDAIVYQPGRGTKRRDQPI